MTTLSTALGGQLAKCAFLPHECPGKSPFSLRHQEARPSSQEHPAAQTARPSVSELPAPEAQDPREGNQESTSLWSCSPTHGGEGAPRGRHVGLRTPAPVEPRPPGLLPSPEGPGGLRVLPPQNHAQVSNKNEASAQPGPVAWAPESPASRPWGTPSQHP